MTVYPKIPKIGRSGRRLCLLDESLPKKNILPDSLVQDVASARPQLPRIVRYMSHAL